MRCGASDEKCDAATGQKNPASGGLERLIGCVAALARMSRSCPSNDPVRSDNALTRETRLGNALDAEIVDREQAAAQDAVAREARQRRLDQFAVASRCRRSYSNSKSLYLSSSVKSPKLIEPMFSEATSG